MLDATLGRSGAVATDAPDGRWRINSAMKNATLFVVIIAALVLFAAACGSSRQATTIKSRPKWVMTAEGLALKMLDEHSKPASVSYHRGQKTLTVTLRFSHAVVCTGCPGGGPAIIHGRIVPPPPIRGRIWTITLDPRTHRMVSLSG